MNDDTFLYFAYGSNMSTSRLRVRCSSARPIGPVELKGHGLRWHKASKDGSGKCDIVKSHDAAETVWGVLYEIKNVEKADLDKAEGGYCNGEIQLLHDSQWVTARTYFANENKIVPERKPYEWYCRLVISGAKEHLLPESYIASLENYISTAAISDLCQAQHD